MQEMLRLKKYSGSSTNAGTDLANDSSLQNTKNQHALSIKSENESDANFFTSSHNNELIGSIGGFKTSSNDVSRDESCQVAAHQKKPN